jgi:hypothetical protein
MESMMAKAKEYQGHRSWNAWNVCLWIFNEEPLYRAAQKAMQKAHEREKPSWATHYFFKIAGIASGERTPDGGRYNGLCVKEALSGLEKQEDGTWA